MRIGIVDDTKMAVEALRRILVYVDDYQIIWTAGNGAEAVEKCVSDPPDLVLMDLLMPVMDGVEATRQIMEKSPCGILIVTSSVSAHAPKVFEAMGYGALDAVDTPVLGVADGAAGEGGLGGEELLTKIATISKLLEVPANRTGAASTTRDQPRDEELPSLIPIGASTGGPMAVASVLKQLPADYPGSVVVVQHVDAQFSAGLARWLDDQTPLQARLATDGCRPETGMVWVAGTNNHLAMQPNLTLSYTAEPRSYLYRPSVDVFFQSVALHWPRKDTAVLLTGMGGGWRPGPETAARRRLAHHCPGRIDERGLRHAQGGC